MSGSGERAWHDGPERILFVTSNGTGLGPPDALDGDRPAPGPRARAALLHPLRGGLGGAGARLSGRVRGLPRKSRARETTGAGRAASGPACGRRSPRPRRGRWSSTASFPTTRWWRRSRPVPLTRLVPAGPVEAGGERGAAHPQPAASTPCSSRASSRPARIGGRRGARRDEAHAGGADRLLRRRGAPARGPRPSASSGSSRA